MPRVLADGPALATSPDGTLVAVLDRGRLSLVDVAARGEIAETIVPVSGVVDLGFADRPARLLSVTRTHASTHVHAFAIPSLEPLAMLEIPMPLRALAFVGERVLLVGIDGDGESARLVTLSRKSLSGDLIALRGPIHVAATAPEERLLVESRGQLEFWDVMLKRALFRLNLPLPPSLSAIGFAGRGRLLWVATSSARGHFEVFRFSDGRRQLQIDLGAPIIAGEGSGSSNRILLAQRGADGGAISLAQIDLGARERQAIELESPVGAFAMVEGEQPVVVVAASGAPLAFVSLSRATGAARIISLGAAIATVEEPPVRRPIASALAAPAGEPVVVAAAKETASAADRFATWRSRLHGARSSAAGVVETHGAAPADDASDAEPMEVEPTARLAIEPDAPSAEAGTMAARFAARAAQRRSGGKSVGSAAAATELAAARPVARIPATRSGEGIARKPGIHPEGKLAHPSKSLANSDSSFDAATAAASLSPAEGASDWRARLVHWGRKSLAADAPAEVPSLDDTLIEVLQERFGLEAQPVRIVALLYAAWLLGDARDGLAVAQVAQLSGDGDNWIEALGLGELARAGIVRARRGRLRLRSVAGRFLDGNPPGAAMVYSGASEPGPELSTLSVAPLAGEPLHDFATRLSIRLGHDFALVPVDGGGSAKRMNARLLDGLFEARLAGALALVSGLPIGGDWGERWLFRLDGAPVVLAVENIDPSLSHLPVLRP